MGINLKLNGKGARELLKSHGVRDELTHRAERVLARAEAAAPVATGDYQASLHLVQATTDRAVVRVVSDVDYAWAVEADTGNLSRALDAAK